MKVFTVQVADAFRSACVAELEALKPGNVHVYGAGHRMEVDDFVRSAEACAGALATHGVGVGTRILSAVEATFQSVGTNTNLGIILLCAPLAAAAERTRSDLRAALATVLDGLDREDAELAFRAIVRASPGGLGRGRRHDVFAPATTTLRQAMAEAAHRDRIAQQYVSVFEDVFSLGLPGVDAFAARWPDERWVTLAVYLEFLAAFPDTHVQRKHGSRRAERTRREAAAYRSQLATADDPAALLPQLLAWDRSLKADGINPGTSADLTVATLFAFRLRKILPYRHNND